MAILFITSTHIGDAVLSTGLLAWLLERYPDDPVTIACGPPAATVLAATPRLERLHLVRKRPWHLHWLKLWRAVAGRRWRIVVDLRRSALSHLLLARRRAVVPKSDEPIHRVELIARTLGLPPQAPVLWTAPEHEARARALLFPEGMPDGAAPSPAPPILAMAPGASWIGKIWPADRFAALAAELTGPDGLLPGARILVLGAPRERALAQPLLDALPAERRIDALGLDILSAAAATRYCSLFVGNDSAMMHLAAAAGLPTVGLFGPTRDEHYGPWGPNGLAVRTPQSVQELIGHPGYDTRRTGSMMTGLEAGRVAAAIRERWPPGSLAPAVRHPAGGAGA